MSNQILKRPLKQDELTQLSAFLALDTTPEALNLHSLHGFLTALHCAPTMFMPNDWLALVMREMPFSRKDDADQFVQLVFRLYNQAATGLRRSKSFELLGYPDMSAMKSWCKGFLRVMYMDDTWLECDDEAIRIYQLPILTIAQIDDKKIRGLIEREFEQEEQAEQDIGEPEEAEVEVVAESEWTEEEKQRFIKLLPEVVQGTYDYWKSRRSPVSGSGESVQQEKVGRNDPCPCGSGKKYKKCCEKLSA